MRAPRKCLRSQSPVSLSPFLIWRNRRHSIVTFSASRSTPSPIRAGYSIAPATFLSPSKDNARSAQSQPQSHVAPAAFPVLGCSAARGDRRQECRRSLGFHPAPKSPCGMTKIPRRAATTLRFRLSPSRSRRGVFRCRLWRRRVPSRRRRRRARLRLSRSRRLS